MDERFDREGEFMPEAEHEHKTLREEHTHYPVREDRRPLRSHREQQEDTAERVFTRTERRMREEAAEREYAEREYAERQSAKRERAERPARPTSNRKPSSSGKHKKRRKKRGLSGFAKGLIVLLVAILIGLLCFTFMKNMMLSSTEPMELSGQTVTVTIPEGSSTEDIAKILKENKLIRSVFLFRLNSKLDGFDGTYKQGTYDIDTGLTQTQIMELLQTGKVAATQKITIPEGYTIRQIAIRAEEEGLCTAEEFISECKNGTFAYDFLEGLPDREFKLEGYLFPDTYFISEGMTAHDLIDMMLKRFQRMYIKEYQDVVAASGYSLDEIVTIASMIEREIKLEEERPRAAGVIYNRLQQNITLGIDATVLYAVGKVSGELTQEDLNVDSPYNTRKNNGLPLGPIANPGESAFKAAIYPETNKYLYYVVEAVGKDNHLYFETYDEFLTGKANYQASAQ
ncbi:MAG: endolytic transglycosylase MltG [Anaerotignum sp.]|nr:endolytic transglycosylase MltG [Anaerotignum sp.]